MPLWSTAASIAYIHDCLYIYDAAYAAFTCISFRLCTGGRMLDLDGQYATRIHLCRTVRVYDAFLDPFVYVFS